MPADPPVDRPVAPAGSAEEARRRHDANQAAWNEGAARYTEKIEATIEFLRAGGSNVHPLERPLLGNLGDWCETAVHLQCASGKDTLSLWVEGARRVVGVDISKVMIANARATAEALDAPASWYCCDVLEAPHELDATADLVYTGRGALNWIHDLDAWGQVVGRLLKPGGVVSILDGHPAEWFFDHASPDLRLEPGIDYFGTAWESQGWPQTYIGALAQADDRLAVKYDRLWTLADVFAALRRGGLVVEHLGEHPENYWDAFPNLEERYRGLFPHTFTMLARRPA